MTASITASRQRRHLSIGADFTIVTLAPDHDEGLRFVSSTSPTLSRRLRDTHFDDAPLAMKHIKEVSRESDPAGPVRIRVLEKTPCG